MVAGPKLLDAADSAAWEKINDNVAPCGGPGRIQNFEAQRSRLTAPDIARRSVLIEQQYIRSGEDKIIDLLDALKEVMGSKSDFDIRIILGKIFSRKDLEKERKNLENLQQTYGLKLGRNIRYIDTSRFVHCHNKMVLIDGKGVLVSSQNWSRSAVWQNREAGVLLEHAGICDYFTQIFESDWSTALKQLPGVEPETVAPETLRSGKFIRVEPGDYREV
jgi:phosphatidylserine/phosphatidylglycerophosphate/cardiolipin synthase-like enzyme